MQPAYQEKSKENIIMMEYWHYLGGVNMEDREWEFLMNSVLLWIFLKLAFLNVRWRIVGDLVWIIQLYCQGEIREEWENSY